MPKKTRHQQPNVRLPKSDRDRAIEAYIARLKSMGPDKVLLERLNKLERDHRATSR